jgi:hypothetical protein
MNILNFIVIIFVLGIGYAWMVRGMFNSMLHLLCVIGAGAIAFAFWEPLAIVLINASPKRGFFSFLEGIAYGVALVVPFILMLLLLRFLADKLIPGNIRNLVIIDYAGGGICGLGTGIITAGILVIGLGTMRLPSNFLGYQPLWYSADRAIGAGALVRSDKLWVPVDSLTAQLYERLSIGVMSTSEPLAKWYPELELVGFSTRISQGDGSGRNAIRPDDFKVKSSYIVGNPAGTDSLADLLKDSTNPETQKYIDINSEPVSKGYLAGYVIDFEPGAKERGKKGGQLVISNGQIRLLVGDSDGNTRSVFPLATISESASPNEYGRWRFDAKDVFITSVGGKSKVQMAFEFAVPQGYEPIALFVKNNRVNLDALPKAINYSSPSQRDRLVRTGSILKGETVTRKFDTSKTVTYDPKTTPRMVRPTTKVGELMSTQAAKRGFTLNEANHVVDGDGTYDVKTEVGRRNAPTSKKLRIEQYALGSGQALIRVNVGPESPFGFLSDAARDAELDAPLLLIDTKGNEYEAIGYEYKDSKIYTARFTRGATLTGIQDTPDLSRSRDDQKLSLLFVVTDRVQISQFVIGDIAIVRFVPPLETRD